MNSCKIELLDTDDSIYQFDKDQCYIITHVLLCLCSLTYILHVSQMVYVHMSLHLHVNIVFSITSMKMNL